MIALLLIIICIVIWLFHKIETKQEKLEKSKWNTQVEDYLWIIKLLKSKGFVMKKKKGLNTNHVTITFENSRGIIVSIDHNYAVLDNNQGKIFLVSGRKKIETNFWHNKERQDAIEKWLKSLE